VSESRVPGVGAICVHVRIVEVGWALAFAGRGVTVGLARTMGFACVPGEFVGFAAVGVVVDDVVLDLDWGDVKGLLIESGFELEDVPGVG
jgi:hypothetical protein